jgi:uncharacterized protein
VRFEWDPSKSEANLASRGFDFAFAARIFERRTVEVDDRRKDYGERRIVAIGVVDSLTLTVVYTDRTTRAGIVRRIISARRSKRREQARYHTTGK